MPGTYDPQTAPTAAGLQKDAYAPREWLFCIPVQVGPPTHYARSTIHWLWMIVGIQAVIGFIRITFLYDFIGGFWMALTVAMGLYAYKQDMNITYVSCWGIACFANGVFDVLSLVLPFIFGIACRGFVELLILLAAPFGYFMGAAFAYHLYHDYELERGGKLMLGGFDPMGKMFNTYDPENIPLSSAKKFDSYAGTNTVKGVAAATAGAAAVAGGGAAAAKTGSGFFNRLFGSSKALPNPQAAAQQGLDAANAQASSAAAAGFGYAATGQDALASAGQQAMAQGQTATAQGQAALSAGQVLAAQKQQEASSWFSGMQSSGQTMFDRAQAQAQEAAAGAASATASKAVAEGVQQGKDQASGFFSSFTGSASQQAAAVQQRGAELQQQGAAQVASGVQQGQDQASGFFSSFMGSASQQAAAVQQRGAELQQQGAAQAAAMRSGAGY